MGMGKSGGRSAGNRTGQGATRKNTMREREYIDPVKDPVPAKPPGLQIRWGVLSEVFWAAVFVSFCCFGAILVAVWFGIL